MRRPRTSADLIRADVGAKAWRCPTRAISDRHCVSNQLLALGRLFDIVTDLHQRSMDMKYSVSIDVPQLDEGLRFYRDALGLTEIARPIATYVILKCGDAQIGIMEKPAGTKPAKGLLTFVDIAPLDSSSHRFPRRRLWKVLAKAMNAGAKCEQKFEVDGRPPIAFCSDPFGNGFCVIGANSDT